MKTLNVKVGSDEWLAARVGRRTSSMAPIIMGYGKKSRNELLRMTATGDEEEFSRWTLEVLFANGHKVEALARPIVAARIGEELAAVTGTTDDDYLLASFDGIDIGETLVWECKQWNEEKAALVRDGIIPKVDYWQCVHHFIVSSAEKLLYSVTDGTEEKYVDCYLLASDAAEDMQTLMANWKQWDIDLAAYVPEEVKPVLMGRTQESLPALLVEVTGMVTSSNLAAFKEIAMAKIQSINLELHTDQDFADAAEDLKWFDRVETNLEDCKTKALAQTQSIEALFNTVDSLKAESRTRRLALEKLVEARKKSVRGEIFNAGVAALRAAIQQANASLLSSVLIADREVPVDFAAAMKGKRNIQSLHDAVEQALASTKIKIGELAAMIHANMIHREEDRNTYQFLFNDILELSRQAPQHYRQIFDGRITQHQAEQQRKEDEQRERIRIEEEQKARDKIALEAKQQADEAARIAREDERKRNTEAMKQAQVDAKQQEPEGSPAPPPVLVTESAPAQAHGVQGLYIPEASFEETLAKWARAHCITDTALQHLKSILQVYGIIKETEAA